METFIFVILILNGISGLVQLLALAVLDFPYNVEKKAGYCVLQLIISAGLALWGYSLIF